MRKGRPCKTKIIQKVPRIEQFKPDGFNSYEQEVAVVPLEEYESIRLHDYLGVDQKKAAEMMGISQQSFSRIVRKARKHISDAIVNAKSIKIEGGYYVSKRSIDIANKLKSKQSRESL